MITTKIIRTLDDAREIVPGDVVIIDEVICRCRKRTETNREYDMLKDGEKIGDTVNIGDYMCRVNNSGLETNGIRSTMSFYREAAA